ncbi:MAG: helix-turn-helix transcriptional regulator [Planctomycetes bacterium]|nr:helix-turn-helix transcriptional regulator [Planctomycetota bacterium]
MKLYNTEQIGSAIRARRKQLEVTQRELALTSGVGLRFVVELEKGKPTCQFGKALKVMQALGLGLHLEIPVHITAR